MPGETGFYKRDFVRCHVAPGDGNA